MKAPLIASYAAVSLAGRRPDNEDRFTRFPSQFGEIILLADGVGGHRGGDKGAEIVVKDFATHLGHLDPLMPVDNALRSVIQTINRRIYDLGHSGDSATTGMGTTIAVAAFRFSPEGMHLYPANAGDSRIYLWRDGGLKRLSLDHTVAVELTEAGLVHPEDADQHPGSRVLTKALGQAPDISPESSGPISLQNGDGVLLCTDGLSSYLTDDQIVNGLRRQGDVREIVHTLAAAALNCGSRDNISIQFVAISEVVSGVHKGARVDHYVLEDFLGAGGMAQVWLGVT